MEDSKKELHLHNTPPLSRLQYSEDGLGRNLENGKINTAYRESRLPMDVRGACKTLSAPKAELSIGTVG